MAKIKSILSLFFQRSVDAREPQTKCPACVARLSHGIGPVTALNLDTVPAVTPPPPSAPPLPHLR